MNLFFLSSRKIVVLTAESVLQTENLNVCIELRSLKRAAEDSPKEAHKLKTPKTPGVCRTACS